MTEGGDWELFRAIVPPDHPPDGADVDPAAREVPGTGIKVKSILALPLTGGAMPWARSRWPSATGASRSAPMTSAWPATSPAARPSRIDNARLYRDVQENNRRKNEFLAMLAHELRNPLAPIRNAVEILRMLDIPDPNLHWANDIITRQVEQLVRLVDDLLDISRITGGKIQLRMEPVDVAVAVDRAVETSRPLIDARRHELSVTHAAASAAGRAPTWSGWRRCSPTC